VRVRDNFLNICSRNISAFPENIGIDICYYNITYSLL